MFFSINAANLRSCSLRFGRRNSRVCVENSWNLLYSAISRHPSIQCRPSRRSLHHLCGIVVVLCHPPRRPWSCVTRCIVRGLASPAASSVVFSVSCVVHHPLLVSSVVRILRHTSCHPWRWSWHRLLRSSLHSLLHLRRLVGGREKRNSNVNKRK